jgi:pimeloyl-ACP methyl ester carboxylesterase
MLSHDKRAKWFFLRNFRNLSTDNLQYMTMEQTVADLVYFIAFIRDLYNVLPTTRVILFGKEIGASIAAWTIQQHPHMVNGVLASSAAMQSSVDNAGELNL